MPIKAKEGDFLKILYLGSLINPDDCTKHKGPSVAGNRMQAGLVKELKRKFGNRIEIITHYPIAAYPREKKIFIQKKSLEITDNIESVVIPFINLFVVKQITKIISTFIEILKWGLRNKDADKIIICYNALPETAIPIRLGKVFIKYKTISLLADLPIDNVFKDKGLKKTFRKIENIITKTNIVKFDGLAVLNKNAIYEYAPSSKYVVIDGGYDGPSIDFFEENHSYVNDSSEFIVIYSGILVEHNGIVNLIEAAKLVTNNRFKLHIYGKGELEDYVALEASKSENITYKGLVSSQEILELQKKASLLVSPLIPSHPVARVAFPSKIVEYMASGTPVISTRVNSLSDDYLKHLFVFDSIDPKEMAAKLDEIIEMDQYFLAEFGSQAKKFIIKHKNWDVQSTKIESLIKQLF